MPQVSQILVAGTGLTNQYALRRRILTGIHMNNSVVPNPVHYRAALEHDIQRFCSKLGVPLVPYAKDHAALDDNTG